MIAFLEPANDKEKMELSEIAEDVFIQKYDAKMKELKERRTNLKNRQRIECPEELNNFKKNSGISEVGAGFVYEQIIRKHDIVLHLKSLFDENVILPIKYANLTAEVHVTYLK